MPTHEFSPELRLLLSLIRAALGTGEPLVAPASGIAWPAFIALVERHRIGPLLHLHAAATVAAVCPAGIAQGVQALAGANSRRALACAAEQIALVRGLAAAGIEVVALKGLVLSQQLHGNLHTRPVGDIDLLLRPADAARADTLMQAGGWTRINPGFPLTPRQTRQFIRVKPEFEYVRGWPLQRVELRWALEGMREAEAAIGRADSVKLGGQAMRTLPADLNLVYLLQHGARHGWFRLFWLVDLAVALRSPGFDATTVSAVARRLDAERSIWQGLQLVEDLLGVACPAPLRPPAPAARRMARLTADARWMITAELSELNAFRGWLRQLLYRIRLQRRIRAKFAVLQPHLFSPATWGMCPLPDRWFFLYYFATPLFWLWRRARLPP